MKITQLYCSFRAQTVVGVGFSQVKRDAEAPMAWIHSSSAALTTFIASLVEFVEAFTIILAVGTTRDWKSAIYGTLAAIFSLALFIALVGTSIQLFPLKRMQIGVGILVLIFGFRWLRKATLRSAGMIPSHNEVKEYSKTVSEMKKAPSHTGVDKIALITTFKAVLLEGFEVAFIVVTAGNVSGHLQPAIIGAGLALVFVAIVGICVHQPLSRVPENSLKKAVGVLLTSFGIFWVGEGLNVNWPGSDAFILVLVTTLTLGSLATSKFLNVKS